MGRGGWARTGGSEDPKPVGVSQTRVKRKTEDQELLLEPWPECLSDGAISEGIERGQLGEPRVVLGNVEFECTKVQEARSPRLLWFSGTWGNSPAALHTSKMETVRKALGYIRVEGLPSAESHLQLPGLGEALASPALPDSSSGGARPQPGSPSQQLGLPP